MKTFFVGTAGLALMAVLGTLAGSAWLTANQRAEAEKPEPWSNPSFTTTAVTTGGMLARWMDSDGNLENGHTYVKGIYDLWKVKHSDLWKSMAANDRNLGALPQIWQLEFNSDAAQRNITIRIERDEKNAMRQKEAAKEHLKNFSLDR